MVAQEEAERVEARREGLRTKGEWRGITASGARDQTPPRDEMVAQEEVERVEDRWRMARNYSQRSKRPNPTPRCNAVMKMWWGGLIIT